MLLVRRAGFGKQLRQLGDDVRGLGSVRDPVLRDWFCRVWVIWSGLITLV